MTECTEDHSSKVTHVEAGDQRVPEVASSETRFLGNPGLRLQGPLHPALFLLRIFVCSCC